MTPHTILDDILEHEGEIESIGFYQFTHGIYRSVLCALPQRIADKLFTSQFQRDVNECDAYLENSLPYIAGRSLTAAALTYATACSAVEIAKAVSKII